ncbi:hypothetical protein Krad_3638 [Kineococcus radiotolerans SRS30216 = ATCC BAA-149]|uniref:DUF3263 domain-containing protein n=1 Tax=Kineococcus radiotolerans (strain ATCC BAA-149 / DSM 14245 / SRS30216) TaxID=266940 RepID=A6WE62_KINRD|nr:hypothetical protein Krad_3638 [Kineococcus radiotolerans SRS30216 = ATCC BAA-149]
MLRGVGDVERSDAAARIERDDLHRDDLGRADLGGRLRDAQEAPLPEGLSPRDAEILAFERQWWKYAGAKEQAVRELFDLSPTRYYQLLNALIDSPAALAHDPMLVKRLRRMRSSRQRARSARRLGVQP